MSESAARFARRQQIGGYDGHWFIRGSSAADFYAVIYRMLKRDFRLPSGGWHAKDGIVFKCCLVDSLVACFDSEISSTGVVLLFR